MRKAVKNLLHFLKVRMQSDKIYDFSIMLIIFLIIVMSVWALFRPIDDQQFNAVKKIALQSKYDKTQEYALVLVVQYRIYFGQYLKLIHAYQLEQTKARELPAVEFDSN